MLQIFVYSSQGNLIITKTGSIVLFRQSVRTINFKAKICMVRKFQKKTLV
jgi:hypothetical protein